MLRAIAGVYVRVFGRGARITIASQAVALLRRFGTDAHVYLPGIGALNGLTAGNYLDSALTTPGTVDNPVGGVVDAVGTINATQATTANKPILRQTSGKYSWQFDGSNDYLGLSSVPFQMADDHCVITGVVSVLAANGRIVSPSAGAGANFPEVAGIYPSGSTTNIRAKWVDSAGVSSIVAVTAPAGAFVVSARKIGNAKNARMNGVAGTASNTVMGAATVTGGAIGAFGAGGSVFNGSTGPIIMIKGTLTDAEMLVLERFAASQTHNGPVF